ncbi:hypothetical protein [Ferrimicrobium sp.]|uniref:hypothetical protein n=1 Tax=Ferrimicrobium sp. TaxID=2926050 RepID=UPI002622ADAB|nr:hypothetical protein [Ferrimicrobium sp.]
MTSAKATQHIDDAHSRTTTWSFADGAETGDHVHAFDYVVIPVTGGTFRVVERAGTTHDMDQEAGTPYVGTKGTAHNVINISGSPAVFVEVELKASAPPAP